MSIAELQKQAHENSKNKGFWDGPFNMGEKLALIHGEVSEAMEADRKGRYADCQDLQEMTQEYTWEDSQISFITTFKKDIKDSWEDEMADAVIRIMDLCEYKGIDLEWHIQQKMKYNATRPHMHGKKY